jgi:hypothetical protein
MSEIKIAFVAYPSQDEMLASILREAISKANSKLRGLRFEPWEFNDVAGNPLISPIIERIEESTFIVADITYLNPNVIYEVGYSIGCSKRAFLIRHRNIEGDRTLARQAGIFDTLGYQEYDDADTLCNRLTSHIQPDPLPFNVSLDRKAPVYVVEPAEKNDVGTMMISRLKKACYRYRSFNPTEDPRLSAVDAIRQVAASAGILLLLRDAKEPGDSISIVHNTRSLFVAGLSHAMEKPALILCPAEYDAPLDVRDEVRSFRHPADIVEHINAFALEITDHLQQADLAPIGSSTRLQSLSIGDPTAENEMTTLSAYYLRTDEYSRAVRGEVNLVVGRKGSGKTALFIQVRDKVRSDKRNIVVDLKPEGYQLIKLKENILTYLTEGTRQHLITAFWEYLLLLEIAYKLLEKDRNTYKYNHEIHDLYVDLDRTYRVEDFSAEGDFSERLLTLSQRIAEEYREKFSEKEGTKLTTEQVTRLLYRHDLRGLRDRISRYLERKQSVWVLFDNLDKGWSTSGVDVIDAIVLRCLIDAGRKVERDMRKAGHTLHCIVFIRNDVYEHLMQHSADYGKEMRAVLDWTDPDLLREMLRLRLVSGLDLDPSAAPFEKVWPTLCVSHYAGEETAAYIIERSLMRPRNVIKIFSHCRGFANNLSHQKITEEDLNKGLLAYSNDLMVEVDHELTDVFPIAKDLLYYFLELKKEMTATELQKVILSAKIEESDVGKVIDFLLYYGVIGLKSADTEKYIYNVNYDLRQLRIRAERLGESARYVINPAFCPALDIR